MKHVTATYHREDGTWWVDSTDLPGFTAVAESLSQLRALTADGIAFYLDDAPHELTEQLESGAVLMDAPIKQLSMDWYTKQVSSGAGTASIGARRVLTESQPGVLV